MKKHKGKLILSGGFLLLTAALQFILRASRNSILIQSGASTYRALTLFARILLGAGIALFAFFLVTALMKARAAVQKEQNAAAQRPKDAPLSLKNGAYDENDIRQMLYSFLRKTPGGVVRPYLEEYEAQLDRMNTYQAQLNQMLRQNGADDMSEAEGFLNKLEQNMFGVMRQVYNLLTMWDKSQDPNPLLKKLAAAKAHNDEVLRQAGRLCSAMTDYINEQENPERTFTSIEMFINALETVQL